MAEPIDAATPDPAAELSLEALEATLAAHPDDVDTMGRLAVLLARAGDLDAARARVDRALQLRHDDTRLHLLSASIHVGRGEFAAAERAFREALLLRGDEPAAHAGLGQIAELRDDPGQAEAHFKAALKLAPDHADAMLGLGRAHLSQNRPEAAVQLLAHVLQLYPRHAAALASYGQALIQRGTPEQAVRPLKRALEIDPDLLFARLLLAHVHLYAGEVPAAEQAYRAVLKAQPANGDALAGLGDALRMQGRMDEAVLAYAAARRRQPDAEILVTLHATCLGALGREQEAHDQLRAFIAAHPRCQRPRLLLADILHGRGATAEVEAFWKQATEADADDALAFSELAQLHEQRGDYAGAIEASRHSGGDTRNLARLMRARLALRAGDHEAALRDLLALKGAELGIGERRDRLRLLGQAHDRAGRWAEAVLAWREAHRIDAGPLPALLPGETLRNFMPALLDAEPLQAPRVAGPVLLLGLPGSGVERVAALLADQPGIAVRDDRTRSKVDFLAEGGDPSLLGALPQSRLAVLARRYARAQDRAVGVDVTDQVIDWVPFFDARVLPAVRLALPGVRVIIADAEPELAFLRWLALGWQRELRMHDSREAAAWLARARVQLDLAAEYLPTLRIRTDAVLAEPGEAGRELAAFLGLETLRPGRTLALQASQGQGLLDRFGTGREKDYAGVLADAFAAVRSES